MTHPIVDLIKKLRQSGVQITIQGSRVHIEAPPGTITEADRSFLSEHKKVVLSHLKGHWIVTLDGVWQTDETSFAMTLGFYEELVTKMGRSKNRTCPYTVTLWKPDGSMVRSAHCPVWPMVSQEEVLDEG